MKRALLIAACCLFFAGMQAQAAEEQKWATSPLAAVASLGELNLQAPTAVDNAGNVFATGQFTQPISIGSAFLEPIANSAYLAKYDAEGNAYLDFISGYGVYGMGRNHPVIAKALKDAIDLDLPNMVQLDCAQLSGLLAERIVKLLNNKLTAVFFCNSGTEANEGAIKFARAHTKKSKIISMDGGYHGLTLGSLSITKTPHFQEGFGPFMPDTDVIKFNDISDLEEKLKKGDVAAFIAEPVIGHGVDIPSDDFFPKAQELCHKYGALFIMDEVQTGLGRTGKMFAFQHWGLEPDIVTIAKALSGGYVPAAAFVTTREIHQSVFSPLDNCVKHSTTFGRNNLAMVAGLASIHVIESEGMVENCAKMGKLLKEKLEALKQKHSYIKEVRGLGLMIAIEFQEPKGLLQKAAWRALKAANNSLFTQMIVTSLMDKYRIITQVTSHEVHAVKLLPPFIITEKEVDFFVKAFDETLSEAANPTGAVMTLSQWKKLFELSDRYGFVIASDECYSEIYFDTPPLGGLERWLLQR